MGPGEEVSTRYLSEDAIVSGGCVDMQQHYVTLYDGSQDAKEQVVHKLILAINIFIVNKNQRHQQS